jgi:hypothetical protein
MNGGTVHWLALVGMAGLLACAPGERRGETPGVFTIVARGLTFEAPEEIASGWTTFRFRNESEMVHFALIERLPEGITVENQQKEVAPVFQAGLDLLVAGEVDAALTEFGKLPEWYGQVVFSGGPGLTAPGRVSETTVYLEPGTYLLECYVKTAGIFHSYNPTPPAYGMVHQFTVTEQVSTLPEPNASMTVTLSSERGIEVSGTPAAGRQTVAVYFEDQKAHENFVGHDLHLAQLNFATDLGALGMWMDWSQSNGLQTPAPVSFLGGAEEMPAGSTAYFTVDFTPGQYAWVSEVTSPGEKGMLVEFAVAPSAGP